LIHRMIDEWLLLDFDHGDIFAEWWLLNNFTKLFSAYASQWEINPIYNNPYSQLEHWSKSTKYKWRRKIIIPSWGMLQWWASLHYLDYLHDQNAVFILPWFQAPGTRWYDLLKNKDKYPATIEYLSWFSGHGDQNDLMKYYGSMVDSGAISQSTKTLLRHGNTDAKKQLCWLLSDNYNISPGNIWIPSRDFESMSV
jgi:predicted metal-dependent RNase